MLRLRLWWSARLLALRLSPDLALENLLALAEPEPADRYFAGMPAATIVRAVRRTLRHPILMRDRRCLREGLLAYRYLAGAGYRPRLHFGIDPEIVRNQRTLAHCWVTLDGKIVIGDLGRDLVEILTHPKAEGRAPA